MQQEQHDHVALVTGAGPLYGAAGGTPVLKHNDVRNSCTEAHNPHEEWDENGVEIFELAVQGTYDAVTTLNDQPHKEVDHGLEDSALERKDYLAANRTKRVAVWIVPYIVQRDPQYHYEDVGHCQVLHQADEALRRASMAKLLSD